MSISCVNTITTTPLQLRLLRTRVVIPHGGNLGGRTSRRGRCEGTCGGKGACDDGGGLHGSGVRRELWGFGGTR
jgi:hypothetical protein